MHVQVFDDGTSPADDSKKTKRLQEWSRQIMGGSFIIYNTIILWNNHVIRVNMHISA